jgi:pimeloyl-ACP methyl ester carboxylesterase
VSVGPADRIDYASIAWRGKQVEVEYRWLNRDRSDLPLLIFLHEGLGSVAMWKDFPQQLCDALPARALVYSRPGYGCSTPCAPGERWQPDFMHRQAHEVLPALLAALGIVEKPWLFGHSDGGSIALLAASHRTDSFAGLIVLAPHWMVEETGLLSIRAAREAYATGGLRERLARYHDDVDSAFRSWNDIWLDPAFAAWNIAAELSAITCPVLAVQGLDDEYGTLAQIHGIAERAPQTQLLELNNCGHSPHRDQPGALMAAVKEFMALHLPARSD